MEKEKEKERRQSFASNSKEAQIKQLEQNPNSGHYYKRLGNEFYKKKEYIKALECYDQAIVITSATLYPHFNFLFDRN